jgi:hypothetical protein
MSNNIGTIVLHRAKVLLECEEHWTLGAWARDENGRPCDPLSSCARRCCAWGALQKCAYDLVGSEQAARKIANRISKNLVPASRGLAFVNERGGYELVQTLLEAGRPPIDAGESWPFADYTLGEGLPRSLAKMRFGACSSSSRRDRL